MYNVWLFFIAAYAVLGMVQAKAFLGGDEGAFWWVVFNAGGFLYSSFCAATTKRR